MGRKKKKKTYYCQKCDSHKTKKGFFKLKAKFKARDGMFPICEDCLNSELYVSGNLREEIDFKAFQRRLRQMDLPFLISIYRSVESRNGGIGEYFKMLALPQYSNKLEWSSSQFVEDHEENERMIRDFITQAEYMDKVENDNLIEIIPTHFVDKEYLTYKYNGDFELHELKAFERNYIELKKGIKIKNEKDKIDLAVAAMIKYRLTQAISNNDKASNISSLQKTFNASMKSLTKIDSGDTVSSLAEIMKSVEEMKGSILMLPEFLKTPADKIDVALWNIEKMNRINHGLSADDLKYSDMYEFYNNSLKEYNKRMGKTDSELPEEFEIDKTPEDNREL